MFGEAAFNAKGIYRKYLGIFYWFTVEFGLISKPERMRIYDAVIISSQGEVQNTLSKNIKVKQFDPDIISHQEYYIWHLQPILFAIDAFEQLEDGFKTYTKKAKLL